MDEEDEGVEEAEDEEEEDEDEEDEEDEEEQQPVGRSQCGVQVPRVCSICRFFVPVS